MASLEMASVGRQQRGTPSSSGFDNQEVSGSVDAKASRFDASGATVPSVLPSKPPRPPQPGGLRSVRTQSPPMTPSDDAWAGISSPFTEGGMVSDSDEEESRLDRDDEAAGQCCCCLGADPCDGGLRRCCVPVAARIFCVWSALVAKRHTTRTADDDDAGASRAVTGTTAADPADPSSLLHLATRNRWSHSTSATATGGSAEPSERRDAQPVGGSERRLRSGSETGANASGDMGEDGGPMSAIERRETRRMKQAFGLLESSAFQADEEEERQSLVHLKIARAQHLIHPFSLFRTRWDVFLVLVITYNAFAISLRIAFDVTEQVDSLFIIDRFVDCLFIIDVILNFRTGIVTDAGAVVLDPEQIVWTYLRGWFLIDLVSAVPYEVFIIIAIPAAYDSSIAPELRAPSLLRIGQIIRIFKAVKMLRLLRLSQVFTRWERAFVVKHAVATVTRFFTAIFFASHFIACAFFFCGSSELAAGNERNWITDEGIESATLFEQYIAAFYWALTTVTTVGYGDIAAVASSERLVSIIAMIIGSTMYAYGLTNIITVAVSMSADKNRFQQRMDAINSYMTHRGVPGSLQAQIRTYLAERSAKGKSWDDKERELLVGLSPQLQAKVAIVVNRSVLRRARFLWHTTPEFVTQLLLSMTHEHFPPGEYMAVEEDPADRLFILTHGTVDILKWGRFRVRCMNGKSPDAFFGELALLEPANSCVRLVSARSRTHSDVRVLTFEALHRTLLRFPRMRNRVVTALGTIIKARRADVDTKCKRWLSRFPEARGEFARRSRKRRGSLDAVMLRAAGVAAAAAGAAAAVAAVNGAERVRQLGPNLSLVDPRAPHRHRHARLDADELESGTPNSRVVSGVAMPRSFLAGTGLRNEGETSAVTGRSPLQLRLATSASSMISATGSEVYTGTGSIHRAIDTRRAIGATAAGTDLSIGEDVEWVDDDDDDEEDDGSGGEDEDDGSPAKEHRPSGSEMPHQTDSEAAPGTTPQPFSSQEGNSATDADQPMPVAHSAADSGSPALEGGPDLAGSVVRASNSVVTAAGPVAGSGWGHDDQTGQGSDFAGVPIGVGHRQSRSLGAAHSADPSHPQSAPVSRRSLPRLTAIPPRLEAHTEESVMSAADGTASWDLVPTLSTLGIEVPVHMPQPLEEDLDSSLDDASTQFGAPSTGRLLSRTGSVVRMSGRVSNHASGLQFAGHPLLRRAQSQLALAPSDRARLEQHESQARGEPSVSTEQPTDHSEH